MLPILRPRGANVKGLAEAFLANKDYYVASGAYQEAEARSDFIDKLFMSLGWDVNHEREKDPYRQEVKIEKSTSPKEGGKADYAFSLAPFYTRVRFLVEAKRPQANILTPDTSGARLPPARVGKPGSISAGS